MAFAYGRAVVQFIKQHFTAYWIALSLDEMFFPQVAACGKTHVGICSTSTGFNNHFL